MSEGPFFRTDTKAVAFRSWLDELGGTSEQLPRTHFAAWMCSARRVAGPGLL